MGKRCTRGSSSTQDKRWPSVRAEGRETASTSSTTGTFPGNLEPFQEPYFQSVVARDLVSPPKFPGTQTPSPGLTLQS